MLALLVLLAAPRPEFAAIEDDPDLPRVLLIGDSISIGYTLPVRERLEGVANVHRPPTNCGPTTRGVESLDAWLGDDPQSWDVIHVNFGLHDLKYVDEKKKNTTVEDGSYQVPPEQYRRNLTNIIRRLKATGATVIWCSTTPVPEGSASRVAGDAEKYNAIAAEVMTEQNVDTNDLHAFAASRLDKIQREANVHFTPEGSAALADQVANAIQTALAKR